MSARCRASGVYDAGANDVYAAEYDCGARVSSGYGDEAVKSWVMNVLSEYEV